MVVKNRGFRCIDTHEITKRELRTRKQVIKVGAKISGIIVANTEIKKTK